MRSVILYGSTRGSTRKVVEALTKHLDFACDCHDVREIKKPEMLKQYDLLICVAPTYGDEELQDDMEDFLTRCARVKVDLAGKYYAVCELGNYYGYDDFVYGAMPIMRQGFATLRAKEFASPLSLDSLPKKDWAMLEKWCGVINAKHAHG